MANIRVEAYVGHIIYGGDTETGTGFLISSTGVVATCLHVLPTQLNIEDSQLRFRLIGSDVLYELQLVGIDTDNDIALLKAGGLFDVAVPTFVTSKSIPEGERFFLTGYGQSREERQKLSKAAFDRSFAQGNVAGITFRGGLKFVQLISQAAILHGMSGSPVRDSRSRVFGMMAERFAPEAERSGQSLAIPIETVVDLAQRCNISIAMTSWSEHQDISLPPAPPTSYVRYPYDLLETRFVGRTKDLKILDDYITTDAVITSVVAMGGMGKSALTSTWFEKAAMSFEGSIWWSFYEEGETYQTFLHNALAYVEQQPVEEIKKVKDLTQLETRLRVALTDRRFLVVLDGMERILRAYFGWWNRYHHLQDDEAIDAQTANYLPSQSDRRGDNDVKEYAEKSILRNAIESNVDRFLASLLSSRVQSRIVITSRLYLRALQMNTGALRAYCAIHELGGLTDDDTIELWQAHDTKGTRSELLELFNSVNNYPLLVHVLAGLVAREDPSGDFDSWKKANPTFNVGNLELRTRRHFILQYALDSIKSKNTRSIMELIAAFYRNSIDYDTLLAISIGDERIFSDKSSLDAALEELVERGLLGRHKSSNTFDYHPVVRAAIRQHTHEEMKRQIYSWIRKHYSVLTEQAQDQLSETSINAHVENFNALVGLQEYDAAWSVLETKLRLPLKDNKENLRLYVELAQQLIDLENQSRLATAPSRIVSVDRLAHSIYMMGDIEEAIQVFDRAMNMYGQSETFEFGELVLHYSASLRHIGRLREAQQLQRRVLRQARKQQNTLLMALALRYLGVTLMWRGKFSAAVTVQSESAHSFYRKMLEELGNEPDATKQMVIRHRREGAIVGGIGYITEVGVLLPTYVDPKQVEQLARLAYELCFESGQKGDESRLLHKGDLIRIMRILSSAALRAESVSNEVNELLQKTFSNARKQVNIEEEITAGIWLAELERRQGNLHGALQTLDDIWEKLEHGHYRVLGTLGLVQKAKIERDFGNKERVLLLATAAYEKAWCDGPPFAFAEGLREATQLIQELGGDLPLLT
jgi:tetratricopeptide (TPR) repeat protein